MYARLSALPQIDIPSQNSVDGKSQFEFSTEVIPLSFRKLFPPLMLPLFQERFLSCLSHEDCNTGSLLVFFMTVIKHHDQKQCGKKGAYFSTAHY